MRKNHYVPPAPNLTVSKSDDVNGVVASGADFAWTMTVQNLGTATATFHNGDVILTDTLPGGPTYDANPTKGPTHTGISNSDFNQIACARSSNVVSCTATGTVDIAAGGGFSASITANNVGQGSYTNPTGGSCKVDPNNAVTGESSESDNDCIPDTVVVGSPAQHHYVTLYKAICPSYPLVPANENQSNGDDTGGQWPLLDTTRPPFATLSDVNTSQCALDSGWSFRLFASDPGHDPVGATPLGVVGPTDAQGAYKLDLDKTMGGQNLWDLVNTTGGLWVKEYAAAGTPDKAGYTFGALRCYHDSLNGDNDEFISAQAGSTNNGAKESDFYDGTAICIAFNVGPRTLHVKKSVPGANVDTTAFQIQLDGTGSFDVSENTPVTTKIDYSAHTIQELAPPGGYAADGWKIFTGNAACDASSPLASGAGTTLANIPAGQETDITVCFYNNLTTDLTATKTDSVSGNAIVGVPFNWTIHVANSGGTATFGTGAVILTDTLPNGFGTPTFALQPNQPSNQSGVTGRARSHAPFR